jgi:hypothetical protein
MRHAFVLLLTTLAAAQQATAPAPASTSVPSFGSVQAPPSTYKFPLNQTLSYAAEWRLLTAGTATIRVESAGREHRVLTTADAAGVVSVLYHVHDTVESFIDPQTFCSRSVTKHTEEGRRRLDTSIVFDYSRKKSVLDETNLKTNEAKHVENDIPGCVTDVLSGLMYLRSLPLFPGTSYTFPLNDGGKTVNVSAKVEAKETVKVPAGTFQTIRVSPESNDGPLKTKGKIWIWYTDDAKRIPVQMRGKMFWGTLTLKLEKIDANKK